MKKTILCIDDAVAILSLYRRIFEEHGYKVFLAANGWDGIYALKQHHVDCVVLDYQMPEIGGAAIVGYMARRGITASVVLVSGADPPRELRSQVQAVLEKPMRVEELLQCVDRAIGMEEPAKPQLIYKETDSSW